MEPDLNTTAAILECAILFQCLEMEPDLNTTVAMLECSSNRWSIVVRYKLGLGQLIN